MSGVAPPPPGGTTPPSYMPPPAWIPIAAQPGPRMDIWGTIANWGRMIGFVLLFVGTLVVVAWGTVNGGCFGASPNNCGPTSSFAQGQHNAIWVADFLWTFGLAAIGAASGIKLHFSLKAPSSGRPEEFRWVMGERVLNFTLFLGSAVLLFWLYLSYASLNF